MCFAGYMFFICEAANSVGKPNMCLARDTNYSFLRYPMVWGSQVCVFAGYLFFICEAPNSLGEPSVCLVRDTNYSFLRYPMVWGSQMCPCFRITIFHF